MTQDSEEDQMGTDASCALAALPSDWAAPSNGFAI
jgi:hypothetical protein